MINYEVWGEDTVGIAQYLWSFQNKEEALRYIHDNKDDEDYNDLWVIEVDDEEEEW